jgi:hypothetical protein
MGLSDEEKLSLCVLARDHWISTQIAFIAYRRDHQKNKRISAYLRLGTVFTALLTAISACANGIALFSHAGSGHVLTWVSVASSLLTAAIVAIDQNYTPRKFSQAFWDCTSRLESIKREIASWSVLVESFSDMKAGKDPLDQISNRIQDATKEQTNTDSQDSKSAEEEFKRTALSQIMSRYMHAPEEYERDLPETPGFDAPGIIAVTRPLSAGATP